MAKFVPLAPHEVVDGHKHDRRVVREADRTLLLDLLDFGMDPIELGLHRETFAKLREGCFLARIGERRSQRVAQKQKHTFGGDTQHDSTCDTIPFSEGLQTLGKVRDDSSVWIRNSIPQPREVAGRVIGLWVR